MHQVSDAEATRIYADSRIKFPRKRDINGPFDFGDNLSVGCALKSVNPAQAEQFGLFAGCYDNKFVVMVIDVPGKCLGGEVFDTTTEMYDRWQVD
jgi:hypothetical protein